MHGYFRDWGPRHSTKFIPHDKPHARDVWGWEAKWLPLSRTRDRPGCGGELYGGVELVNREDAAKKSVVLAVSDDQQ